MSANGLAVFDKTLQTTHIWLDDIMRATGPDRQVAWKVLSTVLHNLRDRLPVEVAAHLSAELPLLVRGVFYDQYQPARQPTRCDLDEFIEEVAEWLQDTRPVDPRDATRALFATLSAHVPHGQIAKVREALPARLRGFWISAEQGAVPPPQQGQAGRESRSFSEAGEERAFTTDDSVRGRGPSPGAASPHHP